MRILHIFIVLAASHYATAMQENSTDTRPPMRHVNGSGQLDSSKPDERQTQGPQEGSWSSIWSWGAPARDFILSAIYYVRTTQEDESAPSVGALAEAEPSEELPWERGLPKLVINIICQFIFPTTEELKKQLKKLGVDIDFKEDMFILPAQENNEEHRQMIESVEKNDQYWTAFDNNDVPFVAAAVLQHVPDGPKRLGGWLCCLAVLPKRRNHMHVLPKRLDSALAFIPSRITSGVRSGTALIRLFLTLGADPHCTTKNGRTLLHYVTARGQEEDVRLLLKYGADAKTAIKDMDQKDILANSESFNATRTPLHVAADKGHVGMVRLFLEHGADPLAVDRLGKTPRQLVTEGLELARHAVWNSAPSMLEVENLLEVVNLLEVAERKARHEKGKWNWW